MQKHELREILKLCREFGVLKLKLQGVELELNEDFEPKQKRMAIPKASKDKQTLDSIKPSKEAEDKIESDSLTPEQLLFWSSGEGSESGLPIEITQGA